MPKLIGCNKNWKKFSRHDVMWIVRISNGVATLARDAKVLDQFGFKMEEIRPFDMTPHHYQVDVVALFVRKNVK